LTERPGLSTPALPHRSAVFGPPAQAQGIVLGSKTTKVRWRQQRGLLRCADARMSHADPWQNSGTDRTPPGIRIVGAGERTWRLSRRGL